MTSLLAGGYMVSDNIQNTNGIDPVTRIPSKDEQWLFYGHMDMIDMDMDNDDPIELDFD